jgi:hypothetical protein
MIDYWDVLSKRHHDAGYKIKLEINLENIVISAITEMEFADGCNKQGRRNKN